MIAETWILSIAITAFGLNTAGGGVGDLSILRLARLVKVFRMARMARLLRMVPELMMILKGIGVAFRSVWFFVVLTVIILYVFAVAFRQLSRETEMGSKYFPTVPAAMGILLLDGMLPIYAPLVNGVSEDDPLWWPLIMAFVLLASVTVLNMLIGVLSEVVRNVASTEKEEMTVTVVTHQLKRVMNEFQSQEAKGSFLKRPSFSEFIRRDSKNSIGSGAAEKPDTLGKMSKNDFEEFCMKERTANILQEVGVDPVGLVDMAEVIFEDRDKDHTGISFEDFIDVVLNLRGSNPATVKDVKETQRILKQNMYESKMATRKHIQKVVGDLRIEVMQQLLLLAREVRKIGDSDADSTDSKVSTQASNFHCPPELLKLRTGSMNSRASSHSLPAEPEDDEQQSQHSEDDSVVSPSGTTENTGR
jgi:hypothetical protein